MEIHSARIPLTSAAALHVLAEERVAAKTSVVRLPENRESAELIVHELEVHQIELEMQNTELREARYEIKSALEKYTDLYEFAPVGHLTLDRNGAISAMNLAAANLLRIERSLLIGRLFGEFITVERTPTYNAFIEAVFTSQRCETCEIVIVNNTGLPLNLQVAATACASGDECHLALIDITDRGENVLQQKQTNDEPEHARTVPGTLELELSACCLRDAVDSTLTMLEKRRSKQ